MAGNTLTLDEQIKVLLRITARLEAGGVVIAYPDELPRIINRIRALPDRKDG